MNATTHRLGRPPRQANRLVEAIRRAYADPPEVVIRTVSVRLLCMEFRTNRSLIRRLRRRARAGLPLIPNGVEIDQDAECRRMRRNYAGVRYSKARMVHVRKYYARKRREALDGLPPQPQLYRRTAFSKSTDVPKALYRDDPHLPVHPADRALMEDWRLKKDLEASSRSRRKRKRPLYHKRLDRLSYPPRNHVADTTAEVRDTFAKVFAEILAMAAQCSGSPMPAPSVGAATQPTATQPGTVPPNSPPSVPGCPPHASPLPRPPVPEIRWLRDPVRWRLLGPQIVNRLLPANDDLRAWYGNLPRQISDDEMVRRIDAILNDPSTVAFAIHPPDKAKAGLHFHVLSLAGTGTERLFTAYGNGGLTAIYEHSSPWKYLNYIDRHSIKRHSAAGLRFGPAAPAELSTGAPSMKPQPAASETKQLDWRHLGPDLINSRLPAAQYLRCYTVALPGDWLSARTRLMLAQIRSHPDTVATAFRPATSTTTQHVLVLARSTAEAGQFWAKVGSPPLQTPTCAVWNFLNLWDAPEFHLHPVYGLHFGKAAGPTLQECNLPGR